MRELSALEAMRHTSMLEQAGYRVRKALKQIVILGLGNELLGDQGIGIHAARRLKQAQLPQSATVVEVGTTILDALSEVKYAERIIVLDAVKDGGEPGTVYKIPLDHCNGSPCIASIHGLDIFRVMALAGRREPLPILVFGVEPKETGWSMSLSPTVASRLPYLIEAVQEELKN